MAGRKGGDRDMVLGGRHLVGIFALLVVIMGVVFTLGYLLGRGQYDAQLSPSVEAAIRKVDKLAGKSEKSEKVAPASKPSAADDGSTDAAANHPADFDFYHAGEGEKAPERLEEPPKPVASKPKPAAAPLELKPVAPKASVAPVPAKTATASIPDKVAETPAKAAASVSSPTVPAKNNGSIRPAAPLNTPQIPAGATVLQVAALVREADALALAQALQQKKFPAFVLTPGADHFYRVQVGPYGNAQSATAARHALESQGFKSIIKR